MTLALPHCFTHNLGFPGGLIGRLISSLKLWKRQSGAVWVLEVKSINDLTMAQPSSGLTPSLCSVLLRPLILLCPSLLQFPRRPSYKKRLCIGSVFSRKYPSGLWHLRKHSPITLGLCFTRCQFLMLAALSLHPHTLSRDMPGRNSMESVYF